MSTQLPDAEELLKKLADSLQPLITEKTALVGIHSGGAWLMDRLLPMLGKNLAHGILDVSFYRDDYSQRGLHSETVPSEIPFDVTDCHIILIDDVFYTGRTIRAAMNELFDYGRPAKVQLAVLVDRGGRELPIEADYAAARVALPATQSLALTKDDHGQFNFSVESE